MYHFNRTVKGEVLSKVNSGGVILSIATRLACSTLAAQVLYGSLAGDGRDSSGAASSRIAGRDANPFISMI